MVPDVTLYRLRLRFGSPHCVAHATAFRLLVDLVDEMAQSPPLTVSATDVNLTVTLISNDSACLRLDIPSITASSRFQWRADCIVSSLIESSSPMAFRLCVAMRSSMDSPSDPTLLTLQRLCVDAQWMPRQDASFALVLPVVSDDIHFSNTMKTMTTSSRCVRLFHVHHTRLEIEEDYGDAMGAHIWDASIWLTLALLDMPWPWRHVVELGAGCGLVACVVALCHSTVVATERHDALPRLRANITRNNLPIEPYELTWGTSPRSSIEPPDMVLAADVLYHWSAHEALLTTLRDLRASRVLLVHKRRGRATSERLDDVLSSGVDTQCDQAVCTFASWNIERLLRLTRDVDLIQFTKSA